MIYAIHCIHPETLNLTMKSFFDNYKLALENLKIETEGYVKDHYNSKNIYYVNKKKEMNTKDDGYYLKVSNRYPNRISVYERSTKVIVGNIYNSTVLVIKKVMVFSFSELASMPENYRLETVNNTRRSLFTPPDLSYIEELKRVLEKARTCDGSFI